MDEVACGALRDAWEMRLSLDRGRKVTVLSEASAGRSAGAARGYVGFGLFRVT
nr:hypothetical protein JVH1_8796 [Rhodococcus sp. JVH1]